MIWFELALAFLKAAYAIISGVNRQQLVSQGYNQAIGEVALSIAAKVHTRDELLLKINAMSDVDVDAGPNDAGVNKRLANCLECPWPKITSTNLPEQP